MTENNEFMFEEEPDIVTLEDEDGNPVEAVVIHDFFYNGENYLALQLAEDVDDEAEEVGVFFMKIVPYEEDDEEMEELVQIEDEDLANELLRVMQESMDAEADIDDAE